MDKTIWLVIGIGVPVAIILAVFGVMESIEKTNNFSDVMNADKLYQDLKNRWNFARTVWQ